MSELSADVHVELSGPNGELSRIRRQLVRVRAVVVFLGIIAEERRMFA